MEQLDLGPERGMQMGIAADPDIDIACRVLRHAAATAHNEHGLEPLLRLAEGLGLKTRCEYL